MPDENHYWETTTLGQYSPFLYGKSLHTSKRNPSGHAPVFGSNGIIGYHDEALTEGPTIIIGRKGTVGAVHYSPDPCWPIDTTFFITGHDAELMRFKYYALRNLGLEYMNSDSAVPGLNRNAAHARELRIPKESEQRRVSHILGTLDDKIELNRRMNETLEEMARTLFKSWFVDFEPVRAKMEGRWCRGESLPGMSAELYDLFPGTLVSSESGDIPEGWEVKTVSDLCIKPQYGYTASAQTEPIGPHFLRITDINKKVWIDWGSVPFCEITDANYQKYRLSKGDILIARMAAPGHGVMIEEDQEAVFASYLIRFRLKAEWYQRFIQYWLRSPAYWNLVLSRSAGTTRASLNAKVISGFPLIVPSDDIVKEFGDRIEDLRDRVVANTSESRTLSSLRDVLLPILVSGNLRVE